MTPPPQNPWPPDGQDTTPPGWPTAPSTPDITQPLPGGAPQPPATPDVTRPLPVPPLASGAPPAPGTQLVPVAPSTPDGAETAGSGAGLVARRAVTDTVRVAARTTGQVGQAARKHNVLAAVALVCAVLGVFTYAFAPVGAVLGHIAKRSTKGPNRNGRGMATAAIAVGWGVTVGYVVLGCCTFVLFSGFLTAALRLLLPALLT